MRPVDIGRLSTITGPLLHLPVLHSLPGRSLSFPTTPACVLHCSRSTHHRNPQGSFGYWYGEPCRRLHDAHQLTEVAFYLSLDYSPCNELIVADPARRIDVSPRWSAAAFFGSDDASAAASRTAIVQTPHGQGIAGEIRHEGMGRLERWLAYRLPRAPRRCMVVHYRSQHGIGKGGRIRG